MLPAMYGGVDFAITPERFTTAPGDQTTLGPAFAGRRPALLANEPLVARIKAYTMLGDRTGDAYAALIRNMASSSWWRCSRRRATGESIRSPAHRPSWCASSARWKGCRTGSTGT
ncbi:MAG: hypothetical protein WDN69_22695 [Aliidongia sp.]